MQSLEHIDLCPPLQTLTISCNSSWARARHLLIPQQERAEAWVLEHREIAENADKGSGRWGMSGEETRKAAGLDSSPGTVQVLRHSQE